MSSDPRRQPALDDTVRDSTPREIDAFLTDGVPSSVIVFLNAQRLVTQTNFLGRIFGRSPVPRSLRTQYRVARGDVAVIDVLTQLGPDWMVRTSEPVDGGGIEHVVIGPSGLFCMIVRHQLGGAIWIDGGVILVDGERLTHLRDAEYCAVKLTQMMSDVIGTRVEAVPCLVLVGPRSMTVAKPPRRVAVMTARDIRTWFKGLSPVFSSDELAALRASAATHSEWQAVGAPDSPSAHVVDLFRKVQNEMRQARHVRLSWVTSVLVLLWLIAVVGVAASRRVFLSVS